MFIVRVWKERREITGAPERWRGRVEHTSSGNVGYFETFDSLSRFIGGYVGDLPHATVAEGHPEP